MAGILMPALSPTMKEGKLARWLVKEGDAVKSGDILAEIETDKATMEFEAVDEGTIGKLLVPEGTEGVAVGTAIAMMGGEGDEGPSPARGEGQRTLSPRGRGSAERSDAGRGGGRQAFQCRAADIDRPLSPGR
jgi:pyruvate/2-oxoglutarate dehydrogenase complex dihydrolipoamide acyltransferase (E2) component